MDLIYLWCWMRQNVRFTGSDKTGFTVAAKWTQYLPHNLHCKLLSNFRDETVTDVNCNHLYICLFLTCRFLAILNKINKYSINLHIVYFLAFSEFRTNTCFSLRLVKMLAIWHHCLLWHKLIIYLVPMVVVKETFLFLNLFS